MITSAFAIAIGAVSATSSVARYTSQDVNEVLAYFDTRVGKSALRYMGCLVNIYDHNIVTNIKESGKAKLEQRVVEQTCRAKENIYFESLKQNSACSNERCAIRSANKVINHTKKMALKKAKLYVRKYNAAR